MGFMPVAEAKNQQKCGFRGIQAVNSPPGKAPLNISLYAFYEFKHTALRNMQKTFQHIFHLMPFYRLQTLVFQGKQGISGFRGTGFVFRLIPEGRSAPGTHF